MSDESTGAWRLLDLSFPDPCYNLAVEESVLRAVGRGESPPTLRLWQNDDAVVIGYSQNAYEEADLEKCERRGTAVVRRVSGGGAVYHDSGNLNYSLTIPVGDRRVAADVRKSFEFLCRGLVRGLAILGLEAEFAAGNDVTVNGRKISGTAQARRWGAVLHHGTLLLDADIQVMGEVLRVKPEYLESKGVEALSEWVTTLRQLGKLHCVKEVKAALVAGFESSLDVRFSPGALTTNEQDIAGRLLEGQYCRTDWNLQRRSCADLRRWPE